MPLGFFVFARMINGLFVALQIGCINQIAWHAII